jgi:hypothetical protein
MRSSSKKAIDYELALCASELQSMRGPTSKASAFSSWLQSAESDTVVEIIFKTSADVEWKVVCSGYWRTEVFKNGEKVSANLSVKSTLDTQHEDGPDIHYILRALRASGGDVLNPSFDSYALRFECNVVKGKEIRNGKFSKQEGIYRICFELKYELVTIQNSSVRMEDVFLMSQSLVFQKESMPRVRMHAVSNLNVSHLGYLLLDWKDLDNPDLFIMCPDWSTCYIKSKSTHPFILRTVPGGPRESITWRQYHDILVGARVEFGLFTSHTQHWSDLDIVADMVRVTVDLGQQQFVFRFYLPVKLQS